MVKLRNGKTILNIESINNNIALCNKYIELLDNSVLADDIDYKNIIYFIGNKIVVRKEIL